jgi:hypothetical protein
VQPIRIVEAFLDDLSLIPVREAQPLMPQAAGLLPGTLPFDLHTLQQGLGTFFAQIEHLGVGLARPETPLRLVPWLTTVAVAVAAYKLVRRWQKAGYPTAWRDTDWTWIPSVAVLPPDEEP